MINLPDLVNGAFELTGGAVCWLNVRRLKRDRKVEGVDWRVSAFFSAWGIWNLVYYPSLGQWASFAGGVALVIANSTWVAIAVPLVRAAKREKARAHGDSVRAEGRRLRHVRDHKAFDPHCEFCCKALADLPEIAHTYKCECDICTAPDRSNLN
jgi:hypothetical protein